MADAKISALPASTTPLAGTEVLPIVQSGATKKVSVANLTVGREISAFGYTQTSDANNFAQLRYGNLKCNGAIVAGTLGDVAANSLLTLHTTVNPGMKLLAGVTNSYNGYIQAINTTNSTARNLSLQPYGGDVVIGTGNFVIGTAGKGIDFSADGQAAGMTSELLDDYEEGTFTPGIAFNNAAVDVTYSTQTGIYTKVGRCVTFSVRIVLTSKGTSTGNMTVTGLPFTSAATYTYGTSFAEWFDFNFGAINPIAAKINPSNTNISMYRNAVASYVQPITDVQVQN